MRIRIRIIRAPEENPPPNFPIEKKILLTPESVNRHATAQNLTRTNKGPTNMPCASNPA